MKFLNNVDINKNQAISLGLEISSSHPASPVAGQVYFNTSDNLVYVYDGTSWNSVAGGLKTARIVIGASTAGWTSSDCDYLCDGTADDVEINAAITALPATGGEIVILDGTYNITAKIDAAKDNVNIRGNGNATILKRMYDSSTEEGVITLTSRSGCKISNLQVDGNYVIYTQYNFNHGIYLDTSSDNTVTGNTCYNNQSSGICLSNSSDNTVTSNTCYNNESSGIDLSPSSNSNTVTGNTCYDNYHSGIFLMDSSSNNTVTGNTCNNNRYGIYLFGSSINTITGNTCNNSGYAGIYLNSSNNNTITGNTCNDNNNSGIYVSSSSNNAIAGNACNNNSLYGINVGTSSNNTITGNTSNNNNYGIYLRSSSNNAVTGNTCFRGTGLPTDYTASQYTIWLHLTGNNYNLISNNNCMGKAPVIDGGTGNTVYGNKWDAGHDILSAKINYTDTNSNLGDATDVQTALDNAGTQLAAHLNSIGLLNYTEENYITDGEPLALSVNNLDMAIAAHLADYANFARFNFSANATLPASSTTDLIYGSKLEGTLNITKDAGDASKFIVPTTGLYLISVSLVFTQSRDDGCVITIYNSFGKRIGTTETKVIAGKNVSVTGLMLLTQGETIQVRIENLSTSDNAVVGASNNVNYLIFRKMN